MAKADALHIYHKDKTSAPESEAPGPVGNQHPLSVSNQTLFVVLSKVPCSRATVAKTLASILYTAELDRRLERKV